MGTKAQWTVEKDIGEESYPTGRTGLHKTKSLGNRTRTAPKQEKTTKSLTIIRQQRLVSNISLQNKCIIKKVLE